MTTSTSHPPSSDRLHQASTGGAAAAAALALPAPVQDRFEPAAGEPTSLQEIPFRDAGGDWQPLPGGELEAPRPRALCRSCRDRLRQSVARGVWPERSKTLCFQCYRAQLDRERRLSVAAKVDTTTEARFQTMLPLEPVNRARLQQLRAERQAAREAALRGTGRFVDRRRKAQIQARHALQRLAAGLKAHGVQVPVAPVRSGATPAKAAADLRLPDAWRPFVSGR